MVCTTSLSQNELNVPTSDPDINEYLKLARFATGKDWQVTERLLVSGRWPFKKETTHFDLFVFVDGMLPWQHLLGGSGNGEITKAFLLGILAGAKQNTEAGHD